jgi:GWxTD domain-containing protein
MVGPSLGGLRVRVHALAVVAGILVASPAAAQVEMSGQVVDLPGNVAVDAISFAGTTPGAARLDVLLLVGYEALAFAKVEDRYAASYEVALSILDSSEALVSEKTWTEEVKTPEFAQTTSAGAYSLTQRVFTLPPGTYSIKAEVRDNESRQTRKLLRRILVPDFAMYKFALSGIMLLNRVTMQGDKRSIVPNVTGNSAEIVGNLSLFQEIYNTAGRDSVRMEISAESDKGVRRTTNDTLLRLNPGKNEVILTFNSASLPLGDYRLSVRAYPVRVVAASDTAPLASAVRPLMVRFRGLPRNLKDLDLAIEQLRYIAKEDEYGYLEEAKTPDEKQKRFLEFWAKRDPNPNTPFNEKMEEYYRRAEYANKNFSHYLEGWRTDMGMVYMIFGPPSNVERHPFDLDSKPYEVWVYYELNYYFMFEDRTGFGDYRLTTPLAEVWNRRPW